MWIQFLRPRSNGTLEFSAGAIPCILALTLRSASQNSGPIRALLQLSFGRVGRVAMGSSVVGFRFPFPAVTYLLPVHAVEFWFYQRHAPLSQRSPCVRAVFHRILQLPLRLWCSSSIRSTLLRTIRTGQYRLRRIHHIVVRRRWNHNRISVVHQPFFSMWKNCCQLLVLFHEHPNVGSYPTSAKECFARTQPSAE